MKLKSAPAPHFRAADSSRGIYSDVIIPLIMLYINPYIYFGIRPVVMMLASLFTCVITETVFCLFAKKTVTVGDLSAVITALIIPLLLPVTVPYYIIVLAGIFAVAVAKMPFGGLGRNPFNPAAAGIAFVTVCFADEVFKFCDTKLISRLPAFGEIAFNAVRSPAECLKSGIRPDILPTEMLLGNFPGPMGATAALVICACGLYMLIRGTIKWQTPLFFIFSAAVTALLFPRVTGLRLDSVIFELLSGSIVFCAVFMANDPVTSPKTPAARAVYGIIGGAGSMLFRYFGFYQEGTCFIILLLNSISPWLDKTVWKLRLLREDKKWNSPAL